MTQEQVALASNLSSGFIALLESGQRLPSLTALIAVAGALKRDAFELLLFDPTDGRKELLDSARRSDWIAVDASLKKLGRHG